MRTPKGNLPRVFDEHLSKETLTTVLGIELVEHGDGVVKGRVPVTDKVTLMYMLTNGIQQNNTSFLRPITEGTVHCECRALHRGRTSWVWDAEHTDDQGRLCALSRVTVAVRPPPSPSA